jgi:hypothetical protein
MAAVPKHVSPWAVVTAGILIGAVVVLALFVTAALHTPRPQLFALDVRMPRMPETPSLPPPPIPVPR